MNEHRHEFSLVLICRVLKVARAKFYKWLHKPISERDNENACLVEAIRHSCLASGGVYGANRILGICEKPARPATAIVSPAHARQQDQDCTRLQST